MYSYFGRLSGQVVYHMARYQRERVFFISSSSLASHISVICWSVPNSKPCSGDLEPSHCSSSSSSDHLDPSRCSSSSSSDHLDPSRRSSSSSSDHIHLVAIRFPQILSARSKISAPYIPPKTCAGLRRSAQVCAGLLRYAQVCAGLRRSAQVCAGLLRFYETSLRKSAQVCASLCKSVQFLRDKPA